MADISRRALVLVPHLLLKAHALSPLRVHDCTCFSTRQFVFATILTDLILEP